MPGYMEIGEDYLVGEAADEVDQMVGEAYGSNRFAMGAARRRPQVHPQSALSARRAAGSTLLKEKSWSKSRQYVLGFDSGTNIAANAGANLTIQPQVIFRAERIVVSGAVSQSFAITDFKVGKNSQFAASGNIPADAFSPSSFGVRLKCDTAQVSQVLTLSVLNLSGSALRFLAAVFGEAVE